MTDPPWHLTSNIDLYYSRRLGRVPQGAGNAYAAGPFVSIPENTTILGAAKITGRTASGWSIGPETTAPGAGPSVRSQEQPYDGHGVRGPEVDHLCTSE